MNICFKFHHLSIYLCSCWIFHYSEFLLFLVFYSISFIESPLMPNFLLFSHVSVLSSLLPIWIAPLEILSI